jgi:xyloglucan 6-xylosyltransferase
VCVGETSDAMNHEMATGGVKSPLQGWNPSRFFATQKRRKVMRTVNAFKVTILCGFITILVLRGTMQAGSGLPDSSSFVDEEAATFQVGLTRTSRVLQAQAEDETPYDAAIAGKFVPEVKWDPSKPFSLGPKISNWDQQRRVWNDRNPMRNVTRDGKPKILLVSGSQPGPCGNPLGDFYHLKFLKNRIDYARIHGMEFFYNVATFQKEMNSFWAKLPLLRNLLLNHPEVEWIWWMDSDAIFTDMTFEVSLERYVGKNIVVHGFSDLLFEQQKWLGLNTGSFLLRNCQWSLDLLDAWAPYGPAGETRIKAGV